MKTGLTGSFELESGEVLWIVHREIPLPKLETPLALPRSDVQKILEESEEAQLTTVLLGKSDDGSRFAFEAPIDGNSLRRKLETDGVQEDPPRGRLNDEAFTGLERIISIISTTR